MKIYLFRMKNRQGWPDLVHIEFVSGSPNTSLKGQNYLPNTFLKLEERLGE